MELSNISGITVPIVPVADASGRHQLYYMRELTRLVVGEVGYPTETEDEASVMVSELATNAAKYAGGGALRFAIARGALRILVVNAGEHAARLERARRVMDDIRVVDAGTLDRTPSLRTIGHKAITIDPQRRSATKARADLRRRTMMTAWAAGFAHDDIVGLGDAADELAMNAPDGVRTVEVYVEGEELVIVVLRRLHDDDGDDPPRVNPDAEGGRGLFIVAVLGTREHGIFATRRLPGR